MWCGLPTIDPKIEVTRRLFIIQYANDVTTEIFSPFKQIFLCLFNGRTIDLESA